MTEYIPGKSCLECDAPIPWRAGAKIRDRSKFCSNACKFSYLKRNPLRPKLPRSVKPCATCGEPVEYLPSQRGPGRSRRLPILTPSQVAECRRRYEAGETQTALAAQFGVSIATMSVAIRGKTYGDDIYCSAECKHRGHSKTMTGRRPSNGVYTSPASFRVIARQAFYDRCSICGWDEAPCDVAHIDARKDGGADTLENVTMLCPNHHRMYDLGLIPVEEVRAARSNCLRVSADSASTLQQEPARDTRV